MDLKLNGRTALVTGASAGIGRAIVKRLADEGTFVIALARRENELESVASEIESAGNLRPALIVQDLLEMDAIARIQHRIKELGRHVDILINNAGGSGPVSLDTPDELWNQRMLLNYARPRELTHALLPEMKAAKWGRIINITGIGEPLGLNATLPAKAAIHSWSKGLSREVGPHNITVNCIGPGRIVSEQALRHYTDEMMRTFSQREIPLGRFGDADELAVAAAFLASPLAGYITGIVLLVDGGFSRHHA